MPTDPPRLAWTTLGHVAVDFEVYYDDEVSITTLGVYHYLRHPKADIYLVAIHDGEQSYVGRPEDFDWTSIEGRHWVSHNRSFDKEVHARLVETGAIEDVHPILWDCTADLASWCRSMRNLKAAVKNLLSRAISKSVRTLMKGLTPERMMAMTMTSAGKLVERTNPACRPFWDDVCEYAGSDARDCWELWAVYAYCWPENERRISRLTGEQGTHGIQMDVKRLKADLAMLKKACAFAKSKLPWARSLPTDEGVLSLPELKKAIAALGVAPPATTTEDSEACREWEAKHPKIKLVKHLRDFRKANILRRRYEHIIGRLKPDGRYSFAWLYGGAHTMRWAGGSDYKRGGTGEKGNNVQNLPKLPTHVVAATGEIVDKPGKGVHTVNLRHCHIAGKGKKWVCLDAEQIEARITLWLAGEWEALARVAAGESIYEIHARRAMGWAGGKLKDEDPDKYFMAKQRVLSLGFGCGKVKFRINCSEKGFPITPAESARQVAEFRAKERKIKALWYRLGNEIEAVARRNSQIMTGRAKGELENYSIELPSGRELVYFAPWIQGQDGKTAAERAEAAAKKAKKGAPAKKSWGVEVCARTEMGGRIKWFYGGLLLENVAQAIARDVLCEIMLKLDDHGIPMLFSVHDEENLEVDEDVDVARIKELADLELDWAEGLPISVELKESDHYCK